MLRSGEAVVVGDEAEAGPSPAEYYESFFVPAMFAPLAAPLVARAGVGAGHRVLDVACGTGIVARRAAAAAGPDGRVVGLDLREGMIACARAVPRPAGAAPIEWLLGDATALDLADGSFDRVLCQQGLQFFPDRPAALREMRRVLAPGGRLAIAVWCEASRQGVIAALTEAEIRHLGPLGVPEGDIVLPFTMGDPDALAAMIAAAGFAAVEVEEAVIEADFPTADAATFVAGVEAAYAAVVPALMDDARALERFVEAVAAEIAPVVERHARDGRLRFPMVSLVGVAAV